jgi:hypothetical protein
MSDDLGGALWRGHRRAAAITGWSHNPAGNVWMPFNPGHISVVTAHSCRDIRFARQFF